MSAPVAALLSAIAAATGAAGYPARIRTTAAALRNLAAARLGAGGNALHRLCSELRDPAATGNIDADSESFTDDDAKVIGFFLARNTSRKGHLR